MGGISEYHDHTVNHLDMRAKMDLEHGFCVTQKIMRKVVLNEDYITGYICFIFPGFTTVRGLPFRHFEDLKPSSFCG
jgi:hypothetical protein